MIDMDLEQQLTNIDKKLTKILNLQTKIAKALHLVPVTAKEEKDLQILQRKNAQLTAQVYDEIEKLTETDKSDKPDIEELNLFAPSDFIGDVFGDVISSDFLDDYRKTEV